MDENYISQERAIERMYKVTEECGTESIFIDRIIDELENLPSSPHICIHPLWIPVSERLPKEHDSIFKKMYGTKDWLPGMFLTTSDTVLASIEKEDGTRTVKSMHTKDGEWNLLNMPCVKKVTHWMPLPEPPKEDNL